MVSVGPGQRMANAGGHSVITGAGAAVAGAGSSDDSNRTDGASYESGPKDVPRPVSLRAPRP